MFAAISIPNFRQAQLALTEHIPLTEDPGRIEHKSYTEVQTEVPSADILPEEPLPVGFSDVSQEIPVASLEDRIQSVEAKLRRVQSEILFLAERVQYIDKSQRNRKRYIIYLVGFVLFLFVTSITTLVVVLLTQFDLL